MSDDQYDDLGRELVPAHTRTIDVTRAARLALASLEGDQHAHNQVIEEALSDQDGIGIFRLIQALAGQGAFASKLLSPAGDPANTCSTC
ncbi:hypothetical protein MX572_22950 (plasmid) [Rhodococcus pyridinivorans]|uniref:hypothetical protein n=1 Tax=Rhodococcus pyridinivorans TaxID=103816 RepID=UPI0020C72C45|nr:hypothetical protein [Rhodococcus pyridinivorans]UTM39670.1 hypothetical protein MX572_22950 [Rhodococcus pyridinivorans]